MNNMFDICSYLTLCSNTKVTKKGEQVEYISETFLRRFKDYNYTERHILSPHRIRNKHFFCYPRVLARMNIDDIFREVSMQA